MAVVVHGAALAGVDALPVSVEVDLLRRLPMVTVVGLAANAVKESAERVRSAVISEGLEFPRQRVVVNLAPADVRKEGTSFDLPVAIGILAAHGQVAEAPLPGVMLLGELSLGGELRPVRGALSLALLARAENKALILPEESAHLAALVPDVEVYAARSLKDVVRHLNAEQPLPKAAPARGTRAAHGVDLGEVRGQSVARQALEIAAAGAHHLLMVGPPGCGKSMLARRLPTILPPMDFEEALDCTRVHAAAGLLERDPRLLGERPFRAPHHSVTAAGLIGGRDLRPGEVSLAHHGVLFLDEAPEFSRAVLEHLREPLEDGVVRITRADGSAEYPAATTLVLAANACPCGRRGGPQACHCAEVEVLRYRRRLSGPILDRIDLHVSLSAVPPDELLGPTSAETSEVVRARVVAARERQRARGQTVPNGRLPAAELGRFAPCAPEAVMVLQQAVALHGLSGRATHRLRKVARTLADLDGVDEILARHVALALAYRATDGL